MLGYEKIPDPQNPRCACARTPASNGDKKNGLALPRPARRETGKSPHGLKATFKLRDGIKSNWGNTFSSQDVKWTWDRKFNLKGQGIFQTSVLGLKKPGPDQDRGAACDLVQPREAQPDPAQAAVQPRQPDLRPPRSAARRAASDDPWGVKFLKNDSAGFGPYKILEQIVRGQQAVFEARDDYWGEKPAMKRVIMKEVPTSSSRLSLLQGGAVDIAQFLQPRELQSLKGASGVAVDAVDASYAIWLELNAAIKPFDNDVRRAFNYAIPQDEIIRTIYYGYADKQTAPMPYIYPMVDTSFFDYDLNLDKAKELLGKALARLLARLSVSTRSVVVRRSGSPSPRCGPRTSCKPFPYSSSPSPWWRRLARAFKPWCSPSHS